MTTSQLLYIGGSYGLPLPTSFEYTFCGGGGGGAGNPFGNFTPAGNATSGGGGGGGGYANGTSPVSAGTDYSFSLGGGGGAGGQDTAGGQGSTSSFGPVTCGGGGGGGALQAPGMDAGGGSAGGGGGNSGSGGGGGARYVSGVATTGAGTGGGANGYAGGKPTTPGISPFGTYSFAPTVWGGGGGGAGGSAGPNNAGGVAISPGLGAFCGGGDGNGDYGLPSGNFGTYNAGGGGYGSGAAFPITVPASGGTGGYMVIRQSNAFKEATTSGPVSIDRTAPYIYYTFSGSGSIKWA